MTEPTAEVVAVVELAAADRDAVTALAAAAESTDGSVPLDDQVRLDLDHGTAGERTHLLARDGSGRLIGYAHLDVRSDDAASAHLVVAPDAPSRRRRRRARRAARRHDGRPRDFGPGRTATRPRRRRRRTTRLGDRSASCAGCGSPRTAAVADPYADGRQGPHLRAGPRRGGVGGAERRRLRAPPRAGAGDSRRPAAARCAALVRPGRILPRRASRHLVGSTGRRCTRRGRRAARSARSTAWASTPRAQGSASARPSL